MWYTNTQVVNVCKYSTKQRTTWNRIIVFIEPKEAEVSEDEIAFILLQW
jgi:hypothetical protein